MSDEEIVRRLAIVVEHSATAARQLTKTVESLTKIVQDITEITLALREKEKL